MQADAGGASCGLRGFELGSADPVVPDDSHPLKPGRDFLEKLELLAGELRLVEPDPTDVLPRPSEARHEPARHRVRLEVNPDDRDRRRGLHGGTDPERTGDDRDTGQHDDVDLSPNELADEGREPIRVFFRSAILDRHRLALDPAQLAKASTERLRLRGHHRRLPAAEVAYPGGSGWLRLHAVQM